MKRKWWWFGPFLVFGCQPQPELSVLPETDAGYQDGCTFWICRGCERTPETDFACYGHEFLTQSYKCPGEFDLCKPHPYQGYCCFPPPGQA